MTQEDEHIQDEVLRHSLEDPEDFWAHQAEHLYWHKHPSTVLRRSQRKLASGVTHDNWEWFPDGEISTCFNCIDRHVLDGHGHEVAIYYDSPVTNTKDQYTYQELLDEVRVLAGALREGGVKKGDVVMLYSEFPSYTYSTDQDAHIPSANDSFGNHRNPCHQPYWRHPLHSFWWLCPQRPRSAYRRLPARRFTHGFLWYRGQQAPYFLPTFGESISQK
jgi:hypothetical protein